MRPEDLTHDDLMQLGTAAIVGNAMLAHELELIELIELIGLSDEHDSLDDARRLRPVVMAAIEQARTYV